LYEVGALASTLQTAMTDYDIHLDDKFGSLQLIDLPAEIAAHDPWFNQTLTTVNDAVVRLGVIEGDFHWHKHDDQDEFFLRARGPAADRRRGPRDGDARPAPGLHGAARGHALHARAGAHRDPDGRVSGRGADGGLMEPQRDDETEDVGLDLVRRFHRRLASPSASSPRGWSSTRPGCAGAVMSRAPGWSSS
jgi:hypothetical protein